MFSRWVGSVVLCNARGSNSSVLQVRHTCDLQRNQKNRTQEKACGGGGVEFVFVFFQEMRLLIILNSKITYPKH